MGCIVFVLGGRGSASTKIFFRKFCLATSSRSASQQTRPTSLRCSHPDAIQAVALLPPEDKLKQALKPVLIYARRAG